MNETKRELIKDLKRGVSYEKKSFLHTSNSGFADTIIVKNPTSPLNKSAQQIIGELQRKLKTLEAEEANQTALKALDEIKALLAGIKESCDERSGC